MLRLARRRQVHPDPAIREAAAMLAFSTRLTWSTPVAALRDAGMSLAEVRAARSIRRAEQAQDSDAYRLQRLTHRPAGILSSREAAVLNCRGRD